MKKNIEIYQIDAFTSKSFQGNSAAVCFADALNAKAKQSIAREMNLSETAFLSKSKNADFRLQWFTPTSEVKLCGHATIAALHFLTENDLLNESQPIMFETRSGILKCFRKNNQYYMQIPIPKISELKKSPPKILGILGLETKQLDNTSPILSVNNEICYLKLKSLSDLKKINVNYNELFKLGLKYREFRILVAYTLETFDQRNLAHSRCFAPFYGINEDPVTGSTNGPLLLVLKRLGIFQDSIQKLYATFEQGDIIGRSGRVGVTYIQKTNELYISGKAVTIFKANLVF